MMKGALTEGNRYLLYELFIQTNAVEDIERLLLFSVNNARVKKNISTALRLNRDYLFRFSSATYAERLVANSLFSSSAVRIKEASEVTFKPTYMDGAFISQLILSKCLQRHKSLEWKFNPLALDELADGETSSGLRCEDYGHSVDQNSTGKLLTVRPTEIWNLLSSDYTASFAQAEVKKFLHL